MISTAEERLRYGRGHSLDWVDQVELLHDDARPQVKVVPDDLDELVRSLVRGAVCLNEHGQGLGDTDGVGELNECAASELGVDERLCDPSGDVGGRAVDLGVVLAREGTATVGAPAAIRVDDDFAAGQAGVALGTADDEEAGGLNLRPAIRLAALLFCEEMEMSNLRGTQSCRQGTLRE